MEILVNPISKEDSDNILNFCSRNACTEFTFHYLCSNKKEEMRADEFLQKFSIYKKNNDRYIFNQNSLNTLKKSLERGILPIETSLELGFEDLTLYKENQKFFEIVSHEYTGFFNLNENEFEEFKNLNIPFEVRE